MVHGAVTFKAGVKAGASADNADALRFSSLKAWQIAEGLRRVHFRKGRNRILYRIENGWQHVAWSLVLCTKPGR